MTGGGHGLNTNASTGHVANMMQYTNNEMTCSSKVHASHVQLLFMQLSAPSNFLGDWSATTPK